MQFITLHLPKDTMAASWSGTRNWIEVMPSGALSEQPNTTSTIEAWVDRGHGGVVEQEFVDLMNPAAEQTVLIALSKYLPDEHAKAMRKSADPDALPLVDSVRLSLRVDEYYSGRRAIFQPEQRRSVQEGANRWPTFVQPLTLKLLRSLTYAMRIQLLDVGGTIVAIESMAIDGIPVLIDAGFHAPRAEMNTPRAVRPLPLPTDVEAGEHQEEPPPSPAPEAPPASVAYCWQCRWTPPEDGLSTPDMTRELLWLHIVYLRAGEDQPRKFEAPLQVKYYQPAQTRTFCCVPRHLMSLGALPARKESYDLALELSSVDESYERSGRQRAAAAARARAE